ncbi:alpha/beta hydrolase [Alkalihalophilus pseudofirmus]|uniref:Alpha/beta hydrolase n=1 Tax=Alkalihalophilus pseudofirmus TaxID=79885 RepID=A0AAJ2KZX3_ALKPS|nr:alpha/beta hydrolase [Alkalihalophilus pseudofirmus]MDV2885058.1 alpha/beta hydrolase [Alkalihalophilus pseudofirmus]
MRLRKHWWKILITTILILIAILFWFLRPYTASEEALSFLQSSEQVDVEMNSTWIEFSPRDTELEANVIMYPGGLLEHESYAPLAHSLAEEGFRTFVIKMPLNLAVLGGNKAQDVIKELGDEPVFIGGHSLGGVMASRFAAENEELFNGVFFLASYPDEKGSLWNKQVASISFLATNDSVLNRDRYDEAGAYFASDHLEIIIEGGNHAQFGSYGAQKGDTPASISTEEQLTQVSDALSEWITVQIK